MTMLQPLDRSNNKNRKRLFIFIVFIILVYIIFLSPVPKYVSHGLHSVGASLWNKTPVMSDTSSVFLSFFTSRNDLVKENIKLKDQIVQMSLRLADRNLLLNETIELKSILSRDNDLDRKLGIVLSRPNKTPYDTLIIDVGKNDNINVNDLVIVESVILGEVSEVFNSTSKVILYSTAGYKTDATIIGSSYTPVEVVGVGGGNYEIRIARDIDVSLGDIVRFAHIKPTIIGAVDKIDILSNDAFKVISFISPVNLYKIKFVEVVLSSKSKRNL